MIVRRLTFTLFCGAALAPTIAPQGAGRHTSLRIGLVTAGSANPPSGAASVARGVRLGAAESKQTAALFGDDVELYEADGAGGAALVAAGQLSSARKIHVLVGASAADADALSSFAESHHILFVNASSRAHSLRAACRRYAFHVEATDTMYANVARVGQEFGAPVSAGGSERSDRAGRDSASLWGPTL